MDRFRYCIYLFISPLLLYTSIQQNSIPLFLCFLIIVVSHLYKDCQDKKWKWPPWTEKYGFLIGFTLFIVSKNIIIRLVGLFKILAHIRQYVFNDNIYYFG